MFVARQTYGLHEFNIKVLRNWRTYHLRTGDKSSCVVLVVTVRELLEAGVVREVVARVIKMNVQNLAVVVGTVGTEVAVE